jgi:hypothetical protein
LEPEKTAVGQRNHTANDFTEQDMHRRDYLKKLLRRASVKGRSDILIYMINWLLGMPRVPGVTDVRRPEGTVYLLDQQKLLNNMAIGPQANMFEIFHAQHLLTTAVVSATWHKQQAVLQMVRDMYPNFPHDTLIPNSHIGTTEFSERVESNELRLIRESMNLMFQSFKQIASCLTFPVFMIDL